MGAIAVVSTATYSNLKTFYFCYQQLRAAQWAVTRGEGMSEMGVRQM